MSTTDWQSITFYSDEPNGDKKNGKKSTCVFNPSVSRYIVQLLPVYNQFSAERVKKRCRHAIRWSLRKSGRLNTDVCVWERERARDWTTEIIFYFYFKLISINGWPMDGFWVHFYYSTEATHILSSVSMSFRLFMRTHTPMYHFHLIDFIDDSCQVRAEADEKIWFRIRWDSIDLRQWLSPSLKNDNLQ